MLLSVPSSSAASILPESCSLLDRASATQKQVAGGRIIDVSLGGKHVCQGWGKAIHASEGSRRRLDQRSCQSQTVKNAATANGDDDDDKDDDDDDDCDDKIENDGKDDDNDDDKIRVCRGTASLEPQGAIQLLSRRK